MAKQLVAVAERHCQGRLVAMHEGGYSELYVSAHISSKLAAVNAKARQDVAI
jgi:acetoin utilization deacetylase AcuC-like enzyme